MDGSIVGVGVALECLCKVLTFDAYDCMTLFLLAFRYQIAPCNRNLYTKLRDQKMQVWSLSHKKHELAEELKSSANSAVGVMFRLVIFHLSLKPLKAIIF
jgi:hypothetical protein